MNRQVGEVKLTVAFSGVRSPWDLDIGIIIQQNHK